MEFGLSAPCRLPNPSRPDGELQGKTRSTPLVRVSEPVPLKARLGHVTFIRLETRTGLEPDTSSAVRAGMPWGWQGILAPRSPGAAGSWGHRALPAVTLHLVGTRTGMSPVAACCWEGARAQSMER